MKIAKTISFYSPMGLINRVDYIQNIANHLSKENKKILLIDANPSMDLSKNYCNTINNSYYLNSLNCFNLDSKLEILNSKKIFQTQDNKNISIIFSSPMLENIAMEWSQAIISNQGNSRYSAVKESLLQKIINFQHIFFYLKKDFDYILVDLSQSSNLFNGLFALSSNQLLTPITDCKFSIQSLKVLSKIMINWKDYLIAYSGDDNREGFKLLNKTFEILVKKTDDLDIFSFYEKYRLTLADLMIKSKAFDLGDYYILKTTND